MKKKYLGVSGKWWIVALALGVVVFIYVKRRGANSTASTATNANNTDTGVDEGQLASDIGAQVASSLGGTPQGDNGGFDTGWLQSLFDQQTQSIAEMFAQQEALAGSGITASGGAGVSAGAGGSSAAAVGAASSAQAPVTNNPDQTLSDSANPATSFYAPGTGAASGGGSPLYAYTSGREIAESPVAGSVFSVSAPAYTGYEALGVAPSAPVTFVPTPMGSNTSPTPAPILGQTVNA